MAAIHFKSGEDVDAGALLINIDDSVEQADLANGLAQLKNAEVTLDAPEDAGRSGQHPAIDRRHGACDPRLGRGDGRADPRGHRPEGDQGAVRRPARPAQCRSRAICRGGNEPRDPAAARSDLRRLSRPRGGFARARRRSAGQNDRRRHSRPQFRGQDRGDRRARQRRIAQRHRARRVRQSRPQASARHVRQSDGDDGRTRFTC